MAITFHPPLGAVLICDFGAGFRLPEMVKRRPVIVVSPRISGRGSLCTVVALSTTAPAPVMPYHQQIDLDPPLPSPWESRGVWIKGDMVNAVGFHRLNLVRLGKDRSGKRMYLTTPQSRENVSAIRRCVLAGVGLSMLTKHLP